jgi:hypothetical protein
MYQHEIIKQVQQKAQYNDVEHENILKHIKVTMEVVIQVVKK